APGDEIAHRVWGRQFFGAPRPLGEVPRPRFRKAYDRTSERYYAVPTHEPRVAHYATSTALSEHDALPRIGVLSHVDSRFVPGGVQETRNLGHGITRDRPGFSKCLRAVMKHTASDLTRH